MRKPSPLEDMSTNAASGGHDIMIKEQGTEINRLHQEVRIEYLGGERRD